MANAELEYQGRDAYVCVMTTVGEIKGAIESLSPEEMQRVAKFCLSLVEELEEEKDVQEARESLEESGENTPWEEVKRENGLCD